MEVILIRHTSVDVPPGTCYGHSDVPLKDTNASQYFDFWNRMAEGSFEMTRDFLKKLADNGDNTKV